MLDLEKTFATDEDKEVEGVWHSIGKGAKVKVARKNNREYLRLIRRLGQSNRAAMRGGDETSEEMAKEVLQEVYAKTILKDWKGVILKWHNGQEVPYTVEDGQKALALYKDFFDLIDSLSEDMDAFRKSEEQEALGNSAPVSGGTSSTEES